MIQKITKMTSMLCFLLFFSSQVLAVDVGAINESARQLQRIQQEQQLIQQLQYEEDLKSSKPPAKLDLPVEVIQPSIPSDTCINIDEIQLLGVNLLKPKDFQMILESYESRCLNVSDIERLMAEVTAVYIQKGYITSRVYLAEQDLQGGILILQVVEGTLERVDVEDNDANSISLFNVFSGEIGQPLNLKDIEQAVDQINRLQSNNVTTSIAPGASTGESVLTLKNQMRKPWNINILYDNYGSESTGEEQATVNFALDNPLGFNDYLSLTHNRTTPYHDDERGSKSSSMTYVVPFGYSTFSFNGSRSNYTSPLNLANGVSLSASGTSDNFSLRLDHTLFRDRNSKWKVSSTLINKESKNFLEGQFLSVSSRKLSTIDIGSSYALTLASGMATFNVGYVKGVDWFGALKDIAGQPSFIPQAQYDKWKYGASYSGSFKLGSHPVFVSSRLTGQYTSDVLYGSEALLIGGIYSVRGFANNSLSGESGFYLRNDISLPVRINPIAGFNSSLRFYVGLDHGEITNNSTNVPDGSLTGAALGMTFSISSINIDVNTSKAVNKLSNMQDEGYISFVRIGIAI